MLTPDQVSYLISSLNSVFGICEDAEITFEVNPDDVTEDYLKAIRQAGVNRLSVGIQTWNDGLLSMLGRRHDSAGAGRALEAAFSSGFENVSADLIYGLPRTTPEDLFSDLQKTLKFPVTHLSAYHLTYEKGTRIEKMRNSGRLKEADEETSAAMFSLLSSFCREKGFIHYEISNFALEGFISRHNSAYWKQVPYIGLGPAAHSFNRVSRQWNARDLRKYIRSAESGSFPFEREELDRVTTFNEYVMTALRTMWGIDLGYVESFYDKEFHDYLVNLSGKYVQYGLLRHEKNTLVLTDQGKMISDNIIAELIMGR